MKRKENTSYLLSSKRQIPFFQEHAWLIHVLVWGMIFVFPFIFRSHDSELVTWDRYLGFAVMLLSTIIVFYLNYIYLIKHYLFEGNKIQFFLINVLVIIATSFIVHWIMEILPRPERVNRFPEDMDREMFHLRMFFSNVSRLSVAAIVSLAIKSTSSWYKSEEEKKELRRTNNEAELQNLKSQLNPHFLFNTLNNIYSLIAFSPEKAQTAVHDLSRLLRYVLYDSSNALISIEKELDFARNTIELMRIRLPEAVDVKTTISCLTPNAFIAPLLFVSLIENAFKHGVSNSQTSFIHINIYQEADKMICRIENSYFPKSKSDKSGSGIGLINLKKRLELLYPNRHYFEQKNDEQTYTVKLSITINA